MSGKSITYWPLNAISSANLLSILLNDLNKITFLEASTAGAK